MESKKRNIFIIKFIILIILFIIIIVCSFKTGQSFYILKHTHFNTTMSEADSEVARWYFNAVIKYK